LKHVHAFSLILRTATIRNDANPDSKAGLRFRSKLAARFLGSTQLDIQKPSHRHPTLSCMFKPAAAVFLVHRQAGYGFFENVFGKSYGPNPHPHTQTQVTPVPGTHHKNQFASTWPVAPLLTHSTSHLTLTREQFTALGGLN
jgi:hypothetical protein